MRLVQSPTELCRVCHRQVQGSPLPATSRPQQRDVSARSTGSSFGTLFRVTTFGESHGKGVGCIVDGVPPRLPITTEEVQQELDRRRPGQSRITTPRKESDTCDIYSGGVSAEGAVLAAPCHCLDQQQT